MGCGYNYAGKWYSNSVQLKKDIERDIEDAISIDDILKDLSKSELRNILGGNLYNQIVEDRAAANTISSANTQKPDLTPETKTAIAVEEKVEEVTPSDTEVKRPAKEEPVEFIEVKQAIDNKSIEVIVESSEGPKRKARLLSSETLQLAESMEHIFTQLLLSFKGDFTTAVYEGIVEEAVDSFIYSFNTAIKNARKYKKHLESIAVDDASSTELIRVTQYLEALETLKMDYRNNDTSLYSLKSAIKTGVNKSLYKMGLVKVQSDSSGESRKIDSSNSNLNQKESYIDPEYNLTVDPFGKLSTRIKAKLNSFEQREVDESGNIVKSRDIIGNTISMKNAPALLAGLFESLPDNSIASKILLLQDLQQKIMANPAANAKYIFTIELLEELLLDGESESVGNTDEGLFSKQDVEALNTALNTDRLRMSSLVDSKKAQGIALSSLDHRFSSAFTKAISAIKSRIVNIVESDYVHFLKDMLNSYTIESPLIFQKGKEITDKYALVRKVGTSPKGTYSKELQLDKLSLKQLLEVVNFLDEQVDTLSTAQVGTAKVANKHLTVDGKPVFTFDTIVEDGEIEKIEVPRMTDQGEYVTGRLIQTSNTAKKLLTGKIYDMMLMLNVDLPTNFRETVMDALNDESGISIATFHGLDSKANENFSSLMYKFISEINGMLNNTSKPKTGVWSIVKWTVDKALDAISTTAMRVYGKTLSTINNPIELNQNVKKLHSEKVKVELSKDVYSKGSRILNIIKGNNTSNISWLDRLFQLPERTSVKPTYKSTVSEKDGELEHELNRFGTFLESIGASYKNNLRPYMGNALEFFDDVIGGVSYSLKVRHAKIMTPTFSDFSGLYKIDSFDFDAVEIINGEPRVKKEYLEYYIDSVVAPELNRAVQLRMANINTNKNAYNASLIYSLPQLNAGKGIEVFLSDMELEGLNITSLFSENLTGSTFSEAHNSAVEGLRKAVVKAAKAELSTATEYQVNKLVDVGLIHYSNGDYYLSEAMQEVTDFQSMRENKSVDKNKDKKSLASRENQALLTLHKVTDLVKRTKVKDKVTYSWDFTPMKLKVAQLAVSKESRDSSISKLTDEGSIVRELERVLGLKEGFLTPESIGALGYDVNRVINSSEEKFKTEEESKKAENGYKVLTHNTLKKYAALLKSSSNYLGELGEIIVSTHKVASKTKDKYKAYNKISADKLNQMVGNYTYSTGFAIANLQQLVVGDMAGFYKEDNKNKKIEDGQKDLVADVYSTMDNAAKRSAKMVSPAVLSNGGGKIRVIQIKEPKRSSTKYKTGTTYTPVGDMDVMDGMAITHTNSFIVTLLGEGEISQKEARLAIKYFSDSSYTEEDMNLEAGKNLSHTLGDLIRKPRVAGHRQETLPDGSTVRVPVYMKFAIAGISKNLADNSDLAQILDLAEQGEQKANKGLDPVKDYRRWTSVIIAPPSVIKTGGPKDMFDLDTESKDSSGEFNVTESQMFTMENDYLGIQVRTDYKEEKDVKPSGQMEDVMFSALHPSMETKVRGKKVNVAEEWSRLVKARAEAGLNEVRTLFKLGTSEKQIEGLLSRQYNDVTAALGFEGEINDRNIAAIIKAAIKVQSSDDPNITDPVKMEFLEIDESTGKFVHNITKSTHFSYYLNILRTAIEKKTIKNHRAGNQYVLNSDYKYDLRQSGYTSEGIILFDNADIDKATGRLRPQLATKPAQVLIPFDLKARNADGVLVTITMESLINQKVLKETGKYTIDTTKLPKELLDQIAYRTPTQDYSMVSSVEVVGFMPREYKTTVVAPAEFTALMGSDFDIDKLFAYRYNLVEDDGGYKKLDEKFLSLPKMSVYRKLLIENEMSDLLLAIAQDKNIVKDEIIQKLDGEDYFKEFGEKLYSIIGNKTDYMKQSYLSPSYQSTKYTNASIAEKAVATFALFQRVLSQYRRANLDVHTKDSNGNLVKSIITVGDSVISKLASDDFNKKVNEVTIPGADGKPTIVEEGNMFLIPKTKTKFSKLKTHVSALLSIALDNEKLVMLHKINITKSTIGSVKALLMLGFDSKSAILMSSIPTHKAVQSIANTFNGAITAKNTSEYIKASGKDSVTSADLSLLKATNRTDGVTKITQEEYHNNLMDLLKDVNSGKKLTRDQIVNLLAISDLRSKANTVFTDVVAPFSTLINMDSKGIPHTLPGALMLSKKLNNPKNIEILAKLGIVEQFKQNGDIVKEYTGIVETVLKEDEDTRKVISILSDSDVATEGISSIVSAINSMKYRLLTPDIQAIIDRLNVLKSSKDPNVIELVRRNIFLANLEFRGTNASYNKNENMTPGDITNALEDLSMMGTVSGIDMAVLHKDLTRLGVTTFNSNYGNTITPYIRPKYYPTKNSVIENPLELAAMVAFSRMNDVTTNKSNTIYKVVPEKGDTFIQYRTTDENGDSTVISVNQKAYDFYFSYTSDDYADRVFDEVDTEESGIVDRNLGETEVDLETTTERLITTRAEIKFKVFLNAILGGVTKIVTGRDSYAVDTESRGSFGELDQETGKYGFSKVAIGKSVSRSKMKQALLHETTHTVLQKYLQSWIKGTLKNEVIHKNPKENEGITSEIEKVFESISGHRSAVIDKTVQSVRKDARVYFKKEEKGKHTLNHMASLIGVSNIDNGIVSALTKTATRKNILDITGRDITFEELRPSLESSLYNPDSGIDKETYDAAERAKEVIKVKLYMTTLFAALDNGEFRTANGKMYYGETKGYLMDAEGLRAMTDVYKAIKEVYNDQGFTVTDLAIKAGEYMTNRFNSDEYTRGGGYMYGLYSMHEYLSQGYTMGTMDAESNLGYTDMKDYTAMVDMPFDLAKMWNNLISMIKHLVQMINGNSKNTLWNDIVYAEALVNTNKFVVANVNSDQGLTSNKYNYTQEGEDILKIC